MNFLFDTTIDVSRRQFYVLAMGSCIGNLAGFLGNALIFGWGGTTIFCGICMLLMFAGSFVGIKMGQIRYASYFMIAVLSLVEFPVLYYIYQAGTIVYMVLAIVGIAIFIPTGNAIRFAGVVIVADVAAVILAYMKPVENEKLSKEAVLQSTLCSLLIVLLCVFLISILLQIQREKQQEEVKELNEQLKEAANRDALTGIYNRRYLNEYLGQLIMEEKQEFDAVLIDLDFFKHMNDTYGHGFGDILLVEFARLLTKYVKDKGIAVRFGGEEFMLILRGMTTDEIRKMLEYIRREYKEFTKHEKNIECSFSSGVQHYTEGIAVTVLYRPADEKLYVAKERGRNQDVFEIG